ncbi:MAG: hypothetical protein HRU24_13205 [Gammaproteobacteria bacterium]|nr:hypothetical protein [Gammaproteobacteria bacterium]
MGTVKEIDPYNKAIDNALLKLATEFNIAVPKDDYLLVQLFLNKEILSELYKNEFIKLKTENSKSQNNLRKASIILVKQHNLNIKKYERLIKIMFASSALIAITATFIIGYLLVI